MVELIFDNTFLILAFIAFCYISYITIFHVYRHNVEPAELAHAYYLVKRHRK